ncbi:FtsX-like permease family protein [Oricola nitratireducens]|uniref:FtsX-like permease family protein n=1 Tax=Oricola nitratireducens TaxID=2775868 RepID=UPI001865F00E|nr:FtsX-like permease family protein [Oricola nitratireducens]
MNMYWISGLVRHRIVRLAGATFGVGITVALLACLGFFLANSSASMTQRAVSAVPIDWQVEAVPAADVNAIHDAIGTAAKTDAIHEVVYAQTTGLEAKTGATIQTTGPGKVIAFDAGYLKDFPKEIRPLSGTPDGALIAQQTAANLHVGPGDKVTINRVGLGPESVTVTGVVDLPDADSLFQAVGLPPQAAPQAPPDNVLILPLADWHRIFDPQQAVRPATTRLQFHVRLDHTNLPAQPTAAYVQVAGAVKNLEVQVAGQALVANNLGARLDAVRGDALYATVLFLFLGVPGVALAAALTIAATASGAGRRKLEQALLRVRGATTRRILSLSAAEAMTTGATGVLLGLAGAYLFARLGLQIGGSAWIAVFSAVFAAVAGCIVALAAVLLPAWFASRQETVSAARRTVGRRSAPLWQHAWLDVIFLAASGLLFWQSASTGYQVVLAPEGVPAASVDYKAFLTPALFWIGSALLIIRIAVTTISSNGRLLRALALPFAGRLAETVAASLSRQARRITLGIAMTALAVSFATSTAIFNTTYNAQARVDAELTNGADVTVFGTTANPAGPHAPVLAKLPGVVAAEPMQHRFAYVGSDLQDIYGIDPAAIGRATSLSNAYFTGGTASEILARLAKTPNGVLVSEETVKDFQLNPGDTVNLRLISASNNQYHAVPFKFIGIAREFPTAPKDSFLVANAAYIAKMTGNDTAEYVLMRASGEPAVLADQARKALAGNPALQVKDVGTVSHIIGSSLTAVDLSSLTRIELLFAVILASAAAGLVLALGFNDRSRDFAILSAIGAKPAQLGAFLWAEGALVATTGIVFGVISGAVTAWMLVKLLTGVFDPPPEALAIPWIYLGIVLVLLLGSVVAAVFYTSAHSRKDAVETLRDL